MLGSDIANVICANLVSFKCAPASFRNGKKCYEL
jgi:hypothetical protein